MNLLTVTGVAPNNTQQLRKNTNLKQTSNQSANMSASNKVSFNGIGSTVANGANKVFKYIDRSSFFVEFLIVDTLSMVLPRIIMGLLRDRDKLGHLNWKSAKEEAGREVLSGPSMNLIPMGILTAVSALKPTARIERNDLAYLSEVAKATAKSDNTVSAKDMAEKIYNASFKNSNGDVNKFVELLEKTTETKGKERKQAVAEFVEYIKSLNDNSAKGVAPIHADRIKYNLDSISQTAAKDLKLSSDAISAADLADSFKAFKNDIIPKVNKANTSNICEFIEKLKSNRSMLKTATAISAFFAVGTFLKYLPKLYQQKGLSPAQESALRASKEKGAKV